MGVYDVDNMNPLEDLQEDFEKIIKQSVIKYQVLAESFETFETKASADQYKSAIRKADTFYSYVDYTLNDVTAAELDHSVLVKSAIISNSISEVPHQYRQALLEARRKRVIEEFEEKNDYYRMLNGYPSIDRSPDFYHYVSDAMAKRFGIDKSIPIHRLQDYYNEIEPGKGDYIIKSLEGLGVIDKILETNPQDAYMGFVGSKRIDLLEARDAKNFEIIYMRQAALKTIEFDEFKRIYEECRLYFMTTIYVTEHRKVIEYYDNFIGMCIMLMALCHLVMRAMPLGVKREYFRDQGIRMLYEAYHIPYDMTIDEIQQKQIAQHINMLIQWKATNRVLYDITDLLGFQRINIYKYYLVKERKFDIYGVPIVAERENFNNDTGEVEIVPDYKSMYDVYFEKVDMKETSYINAFNSNYNTEDYDRITTEDPFWWEDSKLFKELWETEFNIVETKYISLGINYSMREMLYECILSLKMIMEFREELASVRFSLPKICPDLDITMFDAVVLLCCLVCKKHHLRGEIIAIPTQVTDILQYMHDIDNQDFVVDAFGFDFDLLRPGNEEGEKILHEIMTAFKENHEEDEYKKFLSYLSILSINSDATNEEKVETFNAMFKNIRGLSDWISYKLSQTHDRRVYEALKTFYRTAYYARESRELFTINIENETNTRTAYTFFEYLYYSNPKLYSALFKPDIDKQYQEYLEINNLDAYHYTMEQFQNDVDYGNILLRYDTLNVENEEIRVSEEMLYYYIDHIIYRLSQYIEDIDMLYIRNDTETPLERLLIRMIKYFKSLTVDFLGLDITFICDFKNENCMRLFDEVYYMKKLIGVDERYNMLLSDAVKLAITKFHERDKLTFGDLLMLNAYLRLIGEDGSYIYGKLNDAVTYVEKCIETNHLSKESMMQYDVTNIVNVFYPVDRFGLRDKVFKMWYSEE